MVQVQLLLFLPFLCRIIEASVEQDIQLIRNELTELKSKTDDLQRNFTLLESILEEKFQEQLRHEKALLLEKFLVLQQDVMFVNQELHQLTNTSQPPTDNKIPAIQNQLQQDEHRLRTLENTTTNIANRLSAHVQNYYALTNTLTGLKHDIHSTVAFKAIIENQPAVNEGDIIRFDHTEFNEGLSYNTETGEFTCPNGGVYKFETFMRNYENAKLHFKLNGRKINSSFEGYPNITSVSSLLKLDMGDKVWVSHDIDHYRLLYMRNNYQMTGSFLGYLISSN